MNVEALVAALKPFAAYADGIGQFYGANDPMSMSFHSSAVGYREITEADFARAKAAYEGAVSLS